MALWEEGSATEGREGHLVHRGPQNCQCSWGTLLHLYNHCWCGRSDHTWRRSPFPCMHCIDNRKKLLNIYRSSTCPHNMVNFGLLTAEIRWRVWGTPANFNGFRVLAALLHGTLVVGVSQTLWRWTEGATYIWHGDHHVEHWPTF